MNKKWRLVVALAAFVGLAASPPQGPAVNSVMREKLKQAQMILETIVTSNWSGLETHSRELEQLTSDPRWMVLKGPEYARHSSEFIRAVQDLRRVAAQRDSEGAQKAYSTVTLRCVECHRYLARERVAR